MATSDIVLPFAAGAAIGAIAALVPLLIQIHAVKDRLEHRIATLEQGRIRDLEDTVRGLRPLAALLDAGLDATLKQLYRRPSTKRTGGKR